MTRKDLLQSFIKETKEDVRSPTTSTFTAKLPDFLAGAEAMHKSVDFDVKLLGRLRKASKDLSDAVHQCQTSQENLTGVLKELHELNADHSLITDIHPKISTGFLMMSIILEELAQENKVLVHALRNQLLFPLDSFMKQLAEKEATGQWKEVEKAERAYSASFLKLEKHLRHASRDAGWARQNISPSELAEELGPERTELQFQLCQFFASASQMSERRGILILQHVLDYYRSVENVFENGIRKIDGYRDQIEDLSESLVQLQREEESSRRQLNAIQNLLKQSPNQLSDSFIEITETSSEKHLSGVLWKRAAHGLHRPWRKRKCTVENGTFLLYHSDLNEKPMPFHLLACDIKTVEDGFILIPASDAGGAIQFQAEDKETTFTWIKVLRNAQRSLFKEDSGSERKSIDDIMEVEGNRICADCGAKDDVSWVSLNLGCVLCIQCSGIHRELGVQVSRIQSLTLDDLAPSELTIVKAIGNHRLNKVFENRLTSTLKANHLSSSEDRRYFIRSKYCELRFLQPCNDSTLELIRAMEQEDPAEVLGVLKQKPEINDPIDENQNTPLHRFIETHNCCDDNNMAIVELILQNGADPLRQTLNGNTVVHTAVEKGNPGLVRVLLKYCKGSIRLRNKDEFTPSELARHIGNQEISQMLGGTLPRNGAKPAIIYPKPKDILESRISADTPNEYKRAEKILNSKGSHESDESSSSSSSPRPQCHTAPPIPAPRKNPGSFRAPKKCRALYDCEADHPDELSFSKNEVIIVSDAFDSYWLGGYIDGDITRKGKFPSTFVTFMKRE